MSTADMSVAARPGGLDRGALRLAGWWLAGGSLTWFAGVAAPVVGGDTEAATALYESETEREGLLAVGEHTALWVGMNLPLALGTVLALVGLVVLGRALRAAVPSRVVSAGLAAAVVGAAAWVVEVFGRVTVVAARGRQALDDPAVGGDGPYVGLSGVLFFLGYLVPVGLAVLGWVLARRRLPGRMTGIAVAILATAGVVVGVVTFVPVTAYAVGALPTALILLLGTRRLSGG